MVCSQNYCNVDVFTVQTYKELITLVLISYGWSHRGALCTPIFSIFTIVVIVIIYDSLTKSLYVVGFRMEGSSFKSFLKKTLANGELAPLRLFKKVFNYRTQKHKIFHSRNDINGKAMFTQFTISDLKITSD